MIVKFEIEFEIEQKAITAEGIAAIIEGLFDSIPGIFDNDDEPIIIKTTTINKVE